METVVVVSGLWMPGGETALLRRRLAAAGFVARQFSYRALAEEVDVNALRLARFLEGVRGDAVHLLGHSLGGVLAVRALQTRGFESMGRVVCLGAPFQGSEAARRLARLPGGARLIGRSAVAFAGRLVEPWSLPVDLGVIAGSRPIGGGRLLGGLPRPHDGTVAVSETHLEGATDHIILPVTHLSMLWSHSVAAQTVAFLKAGRFERGER